MASEMAIALAAQVWCKDSTSDKQMDSVLATEFAKILDNVLNECEQLRTQLAGCLVAAEGGTSNPAKQGDYGWSLPYQRILDLHAKMNSGKLTAVQREEIRSRIIDFHNWKWCDCSECKSDARSHAVETEESLRVLAAEVLEDL